MAICLEIANRNYSKLWFSSPYMNKITMNHFWGYRLVGFFFPQSLGMVTLVLKLANLTDDQFAGKTHILTYLHGQTNIFRQCINADIIYPQWTGFIILFEPLSISFSLSLSLVSHIYTHSNMWTRVYAVPSTWQTCWLYSALSGCHGNDMFG